MKHLLTKEVIEWWKSLDATKREELAFQYCKKTDWIRLSTDETEWIYLREMHVKNNEYILTLTKAIYSRDTQITHLKKGYEMLKRLKNYCYGAGWPSKSFKEKVLNYLKK